MSLRDLLPEKRKRYVESYEIKNRLFDRLNLFRINMKNMPWWKRINETEKTELTRLKKLKEDAKDKGEGLRYRFNRKGRKKAR